MALAYLACLTGSLLVLAVALLRRHPAPNPSTPTPAAPAAAIPAQRLDEIGSLLRVAADQLATYRPAA